MKGLRSIVSIVLTVSFFAAGFYAQELPADAATIKASADVVRDDDNTVKETPVEASMAAISSTAPGGFWNSPSTWVGGVVPGASDDVTISAGSAVVIDTNVTVANLTVGPNVGFNPGILTFDPIAARSLAVNGNLTVSGLGILTTPSSGTVTTHVITVGGNLTNNGILDLSTNTNQAGAGLVFTNASNNTFGGGGSQTNIRSITVNKGTSNTSTLTLSVLNFTVQGSSTDTAASGYLTLTNGTFKISGLFSGNHRTFAPAAYSIPLSAGIWLNNPNYTIAAQTGDVEVSGILNVSAGVYNIGTAATDSLRGGSLGGLITVDGGSLNISGAMRRGSFPANSYRQTGGVTTTCIAGNFAPCFDMQASGSGGKLVVQTAATVPSSVADFTGSFAQEPKTMVTFGNANTPGTSLFTYESTENSLAIDTTAGVHTVRLTGIAPGNFYDVNIGPGGTLDLLFNNFAMSGTSFVNNGIVKVRPDTRVSFGRLTAQPITYSGNGVFSGPFGNLDFKVPSTTLDPGVARIHTRNITTQGSIINANRIRLGHNDNHGSAITIELAGSLDSAPFFDLGTSKQALAYRNLSSSRAIGPEMHPMRELNYLEFSQSGGRTLTVNGGDLTVYGPISCSGIIDMGSNKLRHLSGNFTITSTDAYVDGTIVKRFSSGGGYTFNVGDDHPLSISVTALSLPFGAADVTVTAHDATLAGLPPATSLSYNWEIVQSGIMNSRMDFYYGNADVNGDDSNYRAWRSAGGSPKRISSTIDPGFNILTVHSVDDLTGSWGLGAPPPPISISGTVFAANGSPIRNAFVKISGGSLPNPILVQTGNFGTYLFPNLDAGVEYAVQASAKRNRFAISTQVISSMTDVANVNFTANPPE